MYPYYHYRYQTPNSYYPNKPLRQFPSVDPSLLHQSALESKKLMKDASVILDALADSQDFDAELMYAAQASDMEEVKRLIYSTGITSNVEVKYNPDGLRLEFKSNEANDCCKLQIALRWR